MTKALGFEFERSTTLSQQDKREMERELTEAVELYCKVKNMAAMSTALIDLSY